MTISIKNLDRICLFVVIVVSGICGYWVVRQGARQQMHIQQENKLFAANLTDLSQADSNLQLLKDVLNDTRREIKNLGERVPKSAEIGKFLKQIDSLIKQRKIVLITLQPLAKVKEWHYNKIPIRLILKGAFNNIYKLLTDIETMNRMLVVEKMAVSKTSGENVCRADLTVFIFER